MSGKNLGSEPRVPVTLRGTLYSGDTPVPCLIEKMSENSILVTCTQKFPVGQIMDFKCELFPEKLLNCKVEVRHVIDDFVLMKIVEIDETGRNLCQSYLEEDYADRPANETNKFVIGENLRSEPRVPVRFRGTLYCGDTPVPCLIENLSQNGILVMCTREFSVGQIMDFKCELFPGKILNCKLEVRHVTDDFVGMKIVEIDETGRNLCQLYLEEHYAERLNVSPH
jgi:hypothetical protein